MYSCYNPFSRAATAGESGLRRRASARWARACASRSFTEAAWTAPAAAADPIDFGTDVALALALKINDCL